MTSLLSDKDVLSILSGWFGNLSAGWFGSLFILPIFFEPKPVLLLTVNFPAAILTLVLAVLLAKRSRRL